MRSWDWASFFSDDKWVFMDGCKPMKRHCCCVCVQIQLLSPTHTYSHEGALLCEFVGRLYEMRPPLPSWPTTDSFVWERADGFLCLYVCQTLWLQRKFTDSRVCVIFWPLCCQPCVWRQDFAAATPPLLLSSSCHRHLGPPPTACLGRCTCTSSQTLCRSMCSCLSPPSPRRRPCRSTSQLRLTACWWLWRPSWGVCPLAPWCVPPHWSMWPSYERSPLQEEHKKKSSLFLDLLKVKEQKWSSDLKKKEKKEKNQKPKQQQRKQNPVKA